MNIVLREGGMKADWVRKYKPTKAVSCKHKCLFPSLEEDKRKSYLQTSVFLILFSDRIIMAWPLICVSPPASAFHVDFA